VEMDVQQVEHWNFVVEKMVDNILHVLMDLEYYKVVLVESVIVAVEEFDSMVHLVVDLTSFDYLKQKSIRIAFKLKTKAYSYMLAVVEVG
jgi:hypothetical protein